MSTEQQQKQNTTVNEFLNRLEISFGQFTTLVISLSWITYFWPLFGQEKPTKTEILEDNVGYYYFLFFRVRIYKDVCVEYNKENKKKDLVFSSKALREKTRSLIDKLKFKSKSKFHVGLQLVNRCVISIAPSPIFQVSSINSEDNTYTVSYGEVYSFLFFDLTVVQMNTISLETALELSKQMSVVQGSVNMGNTVQKYYHTLLQENSSELEDLMGQIFDDGSDAPSPDEYEK